MNRRSALFGMLKGLAAGVAALIITPKATPMDITCDGHKQPLCRTQEYQWSELEQAKELASVLQEAVYAKRIRSYTVELKAATHDSGPSIVIRWSGCHSWPK